MIFSKNLSDVDYNDIKILLQNKIPESDILDYKQELIDDKDFLKIVCAFANTRGGIIVFGITESGKGGHPTDINGIDSTQANKERLEQIILGNIVPRLNVKIKIVDLPTTGKIVMLLQIPNSQYKPHYNNKTGKFHKRFEFEVLDMTEQEIADCYKNRFFTFEEVENYINDSIKPEHQSVVLGNIIVIPSLIDKRLIDTSDDKEFSWLNSNSINPEPSRWSWLSTYIPDCPEPFSHGVMCKKLSIVDLEGL